MLRLFFDAAWVFTGTVLVGLAGVGLSVLLATVWDSPTPRPDRVRVRPQHGSKVLSQPTAGHSPRGGAPSRES